MIFIILSCLTMYTNSVNFKYLDRIYNILTDLEYITAVRNKIQRFNIEKQKINDITKLRENLRELFSDSIVEIEFEVNYLKGKMYGEEIPKKLYLFFLNRKQKNIEIFKMINTYTGTLFMPMEYEMTARFHFNLQN